MSGRQSLAGAFAPVAHARGAALQGLLAPKRGRGAPAPELNPGEAMEAPTRELVQVPSTAAPEAADSQPPTQQPQADERPTEQALVEETPIEATEEQPEHTSASIKAPKATTRQQPSSKKVASVTKASELVPAALRNVGVYLPPRLLAQVK